MDLQHRAGDYFLSVLYHRSFKTPFGKMFSLLVTESSPNPGLLRCQDILNKRNPRLVPYILLDERTKKTNRDSVNNAVRTLIGYGYNIEPPDQESSKLA